MANYKSMKTIGLIVPSLKAGGMERVMSEVANYLSNDPNLEIHLILFSKRKNFFSISSDIIIHRPDYDSTQRIKMIFKFGSYLRRTLRNIDPHAVLSFGSMYNSFVLLFSLGLGLDVYVSDRSNPYRNTELTFKKDPIKRHDGIVHYFLKKILYKKAAGIVVQTEKAKEIEIDFLGHSNVILFPNPVREIKEYPHIEKEQWIINVGRFIPTKNQLLLIKIFSEIQFGDWNLVFAGDGPELDKAKKLTADLNLTNKIIFLGNVPDLDFYLRKSEIFAFPSVSEGFPNALAEGMKASLACISFDCVAGPSDIIKNGESGFLIPNGNKKIFKEKLEILMNNEDIRKRLQNNANDSIKKFDKSIVIENLKKELIS